MKFHGGVAPILMKHGMHEPNVMGTRFMYVSNQAGVLNHSLSYLMEELFHYVGSSHNSSHLIALHSKEVQLELYLHIRYVLDHAPMVKNIFLHLCRSVVTWFF